jgi:pimeloyl-ACP methyl ester carboxylesterase
MFLSCLNPDFKTSQTPLVFLHGYCEDSRVWEEWARPFLTERQVWTIDYAGFGHSSEPEHFNIDYFAKRVHRLLSDKGINKFFLTGHSMGGYVAISFLEKYPENLTGICLFHSHPFEDSDEKKENRLKVATSVRENGVKSLIKTLIPSLFTADFVKSNPDFIENLLQRGYQYPAESVAGCADAMRLREDKSEVLKNSPVPVLFFIGRDDTSIPYEKSLSQTHLPSISKVCNLPNVAHCGMFEAQKTTQDVFAEFLGFSYKF